MLVGAYPYEDTDGRQHSVLRKIIMAEYVLPPDLVLTDSCKDLIRRMFTVDPHQRISLESIKRHPWFTTPLPEAMEVRLPLAAFKPALGPLCRGIQVRRSRDRPPGRAKHVVRSLQRESFVRVLCLMARTSTHA